MSECPTPDKRAFRSAAAAKRWHRQLERPGKVSRLWPYECECGMYHLTTQNYAEQKRIRAAIDAHLGRT